MIEKSRLSVGQVAKRAGVSISTLHFYEEKALISSQRNTGNQRRYRTDVLRRVSVIKTAQKLGISLAEIKEEFNALPDKRTPTQADWERLSKRWQVKLNERIVLLQKLSERLSGCIGCGCLSMEKCPLYNENDYLGKKGSGPLLIKG